MNKTSHQLKTALPAVAFLVAKESCMVMKLKVLSCT